MKFLSYLFFRSLVFLFSIIPFRGIYMISDFSYLLVYHVFKYRKKVIITNLKNSFPEKDDAEIKRITCLFYKSLCDNALESIKGYTVNANELYKRFLCLNPEIVAPYFEEGKDVIVALSHYGNWEWGTQVTSVTFPKHEIIGFYKPLTNPYMDKYLYKLRVRRNMKLASIYDTKFIFRSQSESSKMYLLISDQSPTNIKRSVWTTFLNQDTACLPGIEGYARMFDLPVVYLDVKRVKRGHYEYTLDLLCENSKQTVSGEITKLYMQKLEKIILRKPEDWLWSHRRWKIKRDVIA